MQTQPIDVVIAWVDGSDPQWQKERAQYRAAQSADNSAARYRDWDTLRYWFRGIEFCAPWVRTVHFVTVGHLPKWLNVNNPKLHIVNHRDFIPEAYLPTFSSHTIELNLHRIPGLAQQFIYFNDDMYLASKTAPEDFFKKGLPTDSAVFGIIKNTDVENFMPYIMLNMLAIINMNFSKRQVLKQSFSKWFHPCYGKALLYNLYLAPWGAFTGFRNYHGCQPLLKSTLETVWAKFPEILDRTCQHKFRDRSDVNQYLFRYWQLASGSFAPKKPDTAYLTIGQDSAEQIRKTLLSGKYKDVCVNDDPLGFDFDYEQQHLKAAFQQLFPESSSFERS